FRIINNVKIADQNKSLFGLNHIILMLFSIFFLSTAIGINSVSLPFILYSNNISTSLIGITTAGDVFGGLVIIFLLHKLGKKIGIFNSILLFSIISTAIILVLPFYQNFFLWIFLSFALGISIISLVTLRRAWFNMAIKNKVRGMILAVSSTFLCAGFAVGPVIVKIFGVGDYRIFIASAIFILLACSSLIPLRKIQPKMITGEKVRFTTLIKRNPQMVMARLLTDLQCGTIMFFTVIYGVRSGISPENSGLLISALCAVGMLDFMFGFLINKKSYQKLILFGFIAFIFCILLLPFAIKTYYLAILLYVAIGILTSLGAISCWYGINLDKNKSQLVFINSSFAAIGLFGIFIGNLLTGILMQLMGKEGFVVVIAVASLIYLGFALKNKFQLINNESI
ncbi:MAG: MFS family permease, partial [Rickettsiales bacterium]